MLLSKRQRLSSIMSSEIFGKTMMPQPLTTRRPLSKKHSTKTTTYNQTTTDPQRLQPTIHLIQNLHCQREPIAGLTRMGRKTLQSNNSVPYYGSTRKIGRCWCHFNSVRTKTLAPRHRGYAFFDVRTRITSNHMSTSSNTA